MIDMRYWLLWLVQNLPSLQMFQVFLAVVLVSGALRLVLFLALPRRARNTASK